jgi:hypothetical protein
MMLPLPLSYWEALRQLAEPFELMKFTLIYDGDLPANGKRAVYATTMRNCFHDQLADLWQSSVVLRQLARTARTTPLHLGAGFFGGGPPQFSPADLPDWSDPIPPLIEGQIDLCAPIKKSTIKETFVPLARKSLYLGCNVDILFLRHDEPFKLMKDGGDLDNRLKTLFDGLRMPDEQSELGGVVPIADPLYVLLEDDALISGFSAKTAKLLGGGPKKEHQVRLTIDVTIKVLRICPQNQCLTGD